MEKNNDKKILNIISLEFSFITIKQNSTIKIIKKIANDIFRLYSRLVF